MARNKNYTVKYRRKRSGRTDYKLRTGLLKYGMPRAVIRKYLNNFSVQIIDYSPEGDKVLISAHTKELVRDFGWKGHRGNISSAYLTGLLAGLKAGKKKIEGCTADFGPAAVVRGSTLFSGVKGIYDSGVKINFDEKMVPSDKRISFNVLTEGLDEQKFDKFYGSYRKKGVNIKDIPKHFAEVKEKILKKWQ